MSLKLLSVNTRGLRDSIKRRSIFNFYRSKASIICLQETHSDKDCETVWTNEWGGDVLFSHGSNKSRGVCILFPKGFKQLCQNIHRDQAGRIIKVDVEVNK